MVLLLSHRGWFASRAQVDTTPDMGISFVNHLQPVRFVKDAKSFVVLAEVEARTPADVLEAVVTGTFDSKELTFFPQQSDSGCRKIGDDVIRCVFTAERYRPRKLPLAFELVKKDGNCLAKQYEVEVSVKAVPDETFIDNNTRTWTNKPDAKCRQTGSVRLAPHGAATEKSRPGTGTRPARVRYN